MKPVLSILAIGAVASLGALTPTAAEARPPHGCPPGLAKKNPPCIPPGLAKKGDYFYDYEYERIERRDDRYDFYRIGDLVVSADRKTGRILQLFDELGNELK